MIFFNSIFKRTPLNKSFVEATCLSHINITPESQTIKLQRKQTDQESFDFHAKLCLKPNKL